jgi:GT2 family glycosyltransferase
MDISIVIVSYNTKDLLPLCIGSIKEKTLGLNYEIIVVDNASTDGSADLIRKEFPDVRLIAGETNVGFGKGNNVGIKYATGKYCFLLNPDTLLINNSLKIMYDFMERNENSNIAMCGGKLYDRENKPAISFGKYPKAWTLILYSLPFTKILRSGEGIVHSKKLDPFIVDFVSGADLFIRRHLLETVGAFDESYFAYYEETDLALRASRLGFMSAIIPSARIYHFEGKSFKEPLRRRKIMFESSLYFLKKHSDNRLLFYLYCLLNECKYNFYRLIADEGQRNLLAEMVGHSKLYRKSIYELGRNK